jgi:hypothetical protein
VERREVAGEERVEREAHQVDPAQGIPGVLAQLGLAEPEGTQLAQHEVPVHALVGGEGVHVKALERGRPAVDEREARLPPLFARVRPAVVVAVVADGRREVRLEDEELVEELGDKVGVG